MWQDSGYCMEDEPTHIPDGWYLLRPDEIVEDGDRWWSRFGKRWQTMTDKDKELLLGERVASPRVPPPHVVIRKGERTFEDWEGFPLGEPA